MRFPAKKNAVAHKHHAISSQERWHSPSPVGLPWDTLPPPPESVRTYADVTTKILWIDRLPNLLSNGAPLAGFARRLRYKWKEKVQVENTGRRQEVQVTKAAFKGLHRLVVFTAESLPCSEKQPSK